MKRSAIGAGAMALFLFAAVPPVLAQSGHQGGMHKNMPDKGHMSGKGHMGGKVGGHMMAHDGLAGAPGDPAKVTRTIAITMRDNFFEPEEISIEAGETVRFVVSNEGQFLHEFSLGSAAMHAQHQQQMATMMQHGMITPTGIDHERMKMDHGGKPMMHDAGGSLLIESGQTAELVWTFGEATALEFACNMPGHYGAGMMGQVHFGQGN